MLPEKGFGVFGVTSPGPTGSLEEESGSGGVPGLAFFCAEDTKGRHDGLCRSHRKRWE